MATYLIYKDVVPDVESITTATYTRANTTYSNVALILTGEPNDYASLDLNFWVSGQKRSWPNNTKMAFINDAVSDSNGVFTNTPVIRLDFSNGVTTAGITLDMTDGRAGEINVKWYRDTYVIANETYYPDADVYVVDRPTTDFTAVEISFISSALPYGRLRVNNIVVGIERRLDMHVLQDVSIMNETDLSVTTLPISTLKWTVTARDASRYTYQSKQPVEAYHNTTLIGKYYLKTSERRSERTYYVECTDAIGLLDNEPYSGGIWPSVSARALTNTILSDLFPLHEIGTIADKTLSGVILAGTKRTALQQIFLAWGVVPVTDRYDGITIRNLSTQSYYIGEDKTIPGVTVKMDNIVTEIRVTAHSYSQDASGDVEINGTKYKDTKTVYTKVNPNATSLDQTNIVEITDATFINNANANDILEQLYQYYLRRANVSAQVVWRDDVWLADYITQISGWNTGLLAYIEKMNYSLSNTILVKCESKSTGDVGVIVGDWFRSGEARSGEINA